MPIQTIQTTRRIALIEADTYDDALDIFVRKRTPPEPMPLDLDGQSEYYDRWPVLAKEDGECIVPPMERNHE